VELSCKPFVSLDKDKLKAPSGNNVTSHTSARRLNKAIVFDYLVSLFAEKPLEKLLDH
jgi:hypothetical protein